MEVRTPSVPLWLQNLVDTFSKRTDPLPATLEDWGNPTAVVTAPANGWEAVVGSKDISFGNLTRPLECIAHISAVSQGDGGYSMVGLNASGAFNQIPEYTSGTDRPFSTTPYAETVGGLSVYISGTKKFVLPVGTTTFRLQARRNTSNARNLNYSHVLVVPTRWAD